VREYASPVTVATAHSGSLTDDVIAQATERPGTTAFTRTVGGDRVEVSWERFRTDVTRVAKGLLAAGIGAGDRVGLMAATRYEWTLVDYAIWWSGAVTVPIYPTSQPEDAAGMLRDSGAAACVFEDAGRETAVRARSTSTVRHSWNLTADGLDTLTAQGAQVPDESLEERRCAVEPDSPATIVYTSGATGRVKGCLLTHRNLMAQRDAVTGVLLPLFRRADAATLLVLPMANVLARAVQVACVGSGVRLGHSGDVAGLRRELASVRPTFVVGVPRVLKELLEAATLRTRRRGRVRLSEAAAAVAIQDSRARDAPRRSPFLRMGHAAFDRLVYDEVRRDLGGRLEYLICGGGPLADRLAHLWRGFGVPVLEAYALAEAAGALTLAEPSDHRVGAVGRPVPGTTVRVADDGELLFRGPQVFAGYWGDPTATSAVLSEGWLRSGDLGEIDADGQVSVSGRKREVLVTAGGKVVVPAVLEGIVEAHPLVDHCMVVGDGRPFVAALITLDADALRSWAGAHGKKFDASRLPRDPELQATIQAAVDEANSAVSQAESIRAFHILARSWTEEDGHLTPTSKLRRWAVARDFAAEVEALYGTASSAFHA